MERRRREDVMLLKIRKFIDISFTVHIKNIDWGYEPWFYASKNLSELNEPTDVLNWLKKYLDEH